MIPLAVGANKARPYTANIFFFRCGLLRRCNKRSFLIGKGGNNALICCLIANNNNNNNNRYFIQLQMNCMDVHVSDGGVS